MNKKNIIFIMVGMIVLFSVIGIYGSYTFQNNVQSTTTVSSENNSFSNDSPHNDMGKTSDLSIFNKNNTAVFNKFNDKGTVKNMHSINSNKATGERVGATSNQDDPFANIDLKVSKQQALKIIKEFYSGRKYKIHSMNVAMYHGAPCWAVKISEESQDVTLHVCTVAGEVKLYYAPLPQRTIQDNANV